MRSRFALYVGLFLLMIESILCMHQALWHFDGRGEEKLRVRLSLRVEQQRERPAAAETAMQQKIHRKQIRQLEALDLSLTHVVEVALHECGRQMFEHPRVDGIRTRDDTDVRGVPFIAGARQT